MAANGGQCLSGFAWTMLFLNNIFEKKRTEAIVCSVDTGDPVAPGVGDRGLSPVGGRQAPLFFFLQGLRCKFEEKKLHLSPVAHHRATGVYF